MLVRLGGERWAAFSVMDVLPGLSLAGHIWKESRAGVQPLVGASIEIPECNTYMLY